VFKKEDVLGYSKGINTKIEVIERVRFAKYNLQD